MRLISSPGYLMLVKMDDKDLLLVGIKFMYLLII